MAQIRGSGLLLAGRLISLVIGFAAQVVVVRYLSKGDYGAFAFALSIVSLGASMAAFGLDKATSRFLPMYEERGDRGRALGLLALGFVVIATIGLILVLLTYIGQGLLEPVVDSTSLAVLLLMAALMPVQALDPFMTSILAALSHPRLIFLRRYIVAPVLELAVLGIVIFAAAGVEALAALTVLAWLTGLTVYAVAVVRILRRAGFLGREAIRRFMVPWKEVLSFSVPLLSSDLVFVLRGALVVVLLEVFGSALDVADFRAVFPQARLNLVVLQSFTFLYLPFAARLHERNDPGGMRSLHARTSAWVVLVSFPVFAVSIAFAEPVVTLLYGEQYADSATILAILSAGFFASAVFGFGGLTLRAIGRVRYIVAVDLVTAAAALAAYVVLIPAFGALGAAVGTAGTLLAQALAYHVGVVRAGAADPGWGPLPRLLAVSVAACAGLTAVQLSVQPPVWLGVGLVGVVWTTLVWWHRDTLDIGGIFPELRRVPILRLLVGGGRR